MRPGIFIGVLVSFIVLWSGCASAEPVSVFVAIAPQKYIAERIGGGNISVQVLIPSNSDAHTFEPKPARMTALSGSQAYFSIGLEFEKAWIPRIKAANPKISVIPTDAGIDKITSATHEHEHGKKSGHAEKHAHAADYPDPHIWTSPSLGKAIGANILKGLLRIMPDKGAELEANYRIFAAEADALDAKIRDVFKDVKKGSEFMVFHPSWGYFARDYGLVQVPVEVGGREPSPRELKEIIERAGKMKYRVIFVQPGVSVRTAEVVAKAVGAAVVQVDPLSADWANNLLEAAMKFRKAVS